MLQTYSFFTFQNQEKDIKMKTAIVTLPLHTNYGGLLQAYALKTLLEDMGHEAVVLDIDRKVNPPAVWKAPFVYVKRSLLNVLKFGKGPEVFRECRLKREYPVVSFEISRFTSEYIKPRVLKSYSELSQSDFDAYVVGSDQVWRPEYINDIHDAFLKFTQGWNVRRLSYAASFGTDALEYDYTLLEECSQLLSGFDAVSVRESSGVRMCDEWLDCDRAVHVLDPVMMLPAEHYRSISASDKSAKGGLVTYILDRSAAKANIITSVAGKLDMEVHDVSVYPKDRSIPLKDRTVPCMESWLSAFAHAEFVVTDSFHGCVLCLLFHKPFFVVGNKARGMARIDSLLGMFGLEYRLVDGLDPDDDLKDWAMDMDWDGVESVLSEYRSRSRAFLKSALDVNGSSYSGDIEPE